MNVLTITASASHVSSKYQFNAHVFNVHQHEGKFSISHPVLGSSKDYDSPEQAITCLLRDHGCTNILIHKERPMDLKHLNDLRTKLGMNPLKAWKESKAKLEAAITKAKAEVEKLQETKVTKLPPARAAGVDPAPKKAKLVTTKPEKAKKEKAERGAGSSEASIAAERLGMSPKAVRAKLRKLNHRAGHGLSADAIVKLLKA